MTIDAYLSGAGASPVEELLAELLDREWQAQSGRRAPLGITQPVRECIELVFAATPKGIFAVTSELRHTAASPGELMDRVRDRLPTYLAPWTCRALRRIEALRAPQPLLDASPPRARAALEAPAAEPRALEPPGPVEPPGPLEPPLAPKPPVAPEPVVAPQPVVAPEPRVRLESPSTAETGAPVAAERQRPAHRPRAIATACACGAAAGAPIGLLEAADRAGATLGAVAGALGAAIGAAVAVGRRRAGAQQ